MIVCRDEEMDGEWEAPQIPNPACETAPGCGRWKRPMINNPEYKGKWKAPLVDNPNYQVSDSETFDHICTFKPFKRLVILTQNTGFVLIREFGSQERSATQTTSKTCIRFR